MKTDLKDVKIYLNFATLELDEVESRKILKDILRTLSYMQIGDAVEEVLTSVDLARLGDYIQEKAE